MIMYRTPSYGVGLAVRLRDGQIGEGLYARPAPPGGWAPRSARLLALWDDRIPRLAVLPVGRAQPAGAVDAAPGRLSHESIIYSRPLACRNCLATSAGFCLSRSTAAFIFCIASVVSFALTALSVVVELRALLR